MVEYKDLPKRCYDCPRVRKVDLYHVGSIRDEEVLSKIIGRCGLTLKQSELVTIKVHKHKRKLQFCNCGKVADLKLVFVSRGWKNYTKYFCTSCVYDKAYHYITNLLNNFAYNRVNLKELEPLLLATLLSDVDDSTKMYVKKALQNEV